MDDGGANGANGSSLITTGRRDQHQGILPTRAVDSMQHSRFLRDDNHTVDLGLWLGFSPDHGSFKLVSTFSQTFLNFWLKVIIALILDKLRPNYTICNL